MSSFENRQVDHINRKRLNVVSGNYTDDGKIVSLVVDVVREDGYKDGDTVGTRFDKESMENAIESYILKNIFGLNINFDHKNISITGSASKTLVVSSAIPIKAKVINKGGFTIGISQGTEDEPLFINISRPNGGTSAISEEYDINLYTDSQLKNFLCKLKGKITYTPSSTGSGD